MDMRGKIRNRKSNLFVAGLALAALLLTGSSAGPSSLEKYTLSGYAQGTTYSITYYAAYPIITESAVDSIISVIDSSMSLYKPYSAISRFNKGKDSSVVVDDHFRKVVEKSFEIYRHSNGVFDITVAPLVQLWGFGPQKIQRFPDGNEVLETLACVGMDKIQLDGAVLSRKDTCVQLDVNGIAQGYTVDVLADFMEQKGVLYYIVELGGELRVKGPKPDGSPMRIGIERPPHKGSSSVTIQDIMEISEGAITTAGSYRKFLNDGERTVSHHIDPATGYPFETAIVSATIYAKDAITADGYDNVIMAMAAAQAVDFVNRQEGLEVYIIYRDDEGSIRETMSDGFGVLLKSN